MPSTPSLNVSLTAHLEQFIATLLSSGRYQSASEVVRAGLRLLEKFEAADLHELAADMGYEVDRGSVRRAGVKPKGKTRPSRPGRNRGIGQAEPTEEQRDE